MKGLRSWTILGGSLAVVAAIAVFVGSAKRKAARASMHREVDKDKLEFQRQLDEAHRLREFARSITEGKHHDNFQRRDYIAFGLFNRCLQTHEGRVEHP
jgi:hypothetical protein